MHPMQYGIGPGIQKGRTLGNEGEKVEKSIPESVHFKHLMRRVAMEEESLGEKRQKPMTQKEDQNSHMQKNDIEIAR
jgi:hypothetical protein